MYADRLRKIGHLHGAHGSPNGTTPAGKAVTIPGLRWVRAWDQADRYSDEDAGRGVAIMVARTAFRGGPSSPEHLGSGVVCLARFLKAYGREPVPPSSGPP